MKTKWEQNQAPFGGSVNFTLEGEGFYISYSANPGGNISMFKNDNNSEETALCKDGSFYILDGDFRKDYEKLITKGFDACWDFYQKMKVDHHCSWSTDYLDYP